MTFLECRQLIKSDLIRLTPINKWGGVKHLLFNASFQITFWFRLGCYLQGKRNPFLKVLYLCVFLIHKHYQNKTGIQLPIGTRIGKGLRFAHFSCIVINRYAIIGDGCTIFQGVTVGSVRGEGGGVPIIGNNVVLSSGAKVIGGVKIGNNVMVGANAVVVKDIIADAVCVGIPAKVVNMKGKSRCEPYYYNY